MKVVLALAPVWQSSTPPLSLAFLKASLIKNGIDTFCIDFSIQFRPIMVSVMGDIAAEEYVAENPSTYKSWAKQIAVQKPDVVGFSVLMSNIKITAMIASELKTLLPNITIIAGGPSFTRENIKYIRYATKFSKYIIEGEAESMISDLINTIANNGDVGKLKQIWLLDEKNELKYTGAAPLQPINEIPFPDFRDFDLNAYPEKNKLPLLFSRGCILNCNYCENKWNHLTQRSRSAENVFLELKRNVIEYKMEKYIFNDDSLISYKTIHELDKYCDMVIAEDLILPWHVYGTRVENKLTQPFVAKLRKAGMYGVSLGIETFSTKIQKEMGKSSKYNDADNCARLFGDNGINTETWIIYGYPTENDKDFEDTLNWFIQNPNVLSHVTANTFGPNAKYRTDRPDVIKYNSNNSWDWSGPESTLEKRKKRFLQLIEVLETIRKNRKGKFSFHVGDPYYVKYFNTFTKKDKAYLMEAWDKLEGVYFEKRKFKKMLFNLGLINEKIPTTMSKSQDVEDEYENLHSPENETIVSNITDAVIREALYNTNDNVSYLIKSINEDINNYLFTVKKLDAEVVSLKTKEYTDKLLQTSKLLDPYISENIFLKIVHQENIILILKGIDRSTIEEHVDDIKKFLIPKIRLIQKEKA
jgi:anaerobic magnesium-protoporphyrin IX monomethyl ester cyclase